MYSGRYIKGKELEALITGFEIPNNARGNMARRIAADLSIDLLNEITRDEAIGDLGARREELRRDFEPTAYASVLAMEVLANDGIDAAREFQNIQAAALSLIDSMNELTASEKSDLKREIQGLRPDSANGRQQALASISRIVDLARRKAGDEIAANFLEVAILAARAENAELRARIAGTRYENLMKRAEELLAIPEAEMTTENKIDLFLTVMGKTRETIGMSPEALAAFAESPDFEAQIDALRDNPDAQRNLLVRYNQQHEQDVAIDSLPEGSEERRARELERDLGVVPSDIGLTRPPRTRGEVRDAYIASARSEYASVRGMISGSARAHIGDGQAAGDAALNRAMDIYERGGDRRRAAFADLQNGGSMSADAAAIEFATAMSARLAMRTLVRTHGRGLSTPEALMEAMRQEDPRLRNVPDSILAPLAIQARNAYGNGSRFTGSTEQIEAQIEASSRTVTRSTLLNTQQVINESRAMRAAADARGTNAQNDEARNNLRHTEGRSVVELEFGDVANILQRAGVGQGKSALDMVNLCESLGIFENNGIATNRVGDGVAYINHLNGSYDNFHQWADRSRRRIDLNGDGQISGLEALNAVQLAELMQSNAAFRRLVNPDGGVLDNAQLRNGLALVDKIRERIENSGYYNSRIDTDRDGRIEANEVANALARVGVSQASAIDGANFARVMNRAASLS